ncbi:multidrug effflux MFS transporter [Martelella sp. HB161492]|uniref:multidrug effflux MFS transporter n=1 Tax=Martelella sp. HB161492 TaxID=2720726 RepID=UPI001590AFEA|nr:multidrug effflux MFS transporter [Martelella sp. HB161492]
MAKDIHTSHTEGARIAYSWPMIITLGFLVSMGALHLDPIASSLPAMAKALGVPANATAYTVSAFFFGMMIGHLLIGPFSDIFGRKRTILFGLAVLAVGSSTCALSSDMTMLLVGRALQGLGGAAVMCTGRAVGGDAGKGKASANMLSIMQVVSSCTPIVMPLLGQAVASSFDWRAVFWTMAIMNVALFCAVGLFLKETATTTGRSGAFSALAHDVRVVFSQPGFLLFAITFGFGISTFFCYVGAASFVFQNELGISAGQFSVIFSGLAASMVVGGLVSSFFTRWLEPFAFVVTVIFLQLLDAAAVVFLFKTGMATIPVIAVLFGFIAFSTSIVIPVGLSLALSESGDIKGSAAAFCGFAQYCFSMGVTTYIGSVKATGSVGKACGIAMMVTTACALIAAFSGRAVIRRRDAAPDGKAPSVHA